MNARPNSKRRALTAALMVAGLSASAFAAGSSVGQVSLIIGEAHVMRSDGQRELLRRGSPIRVGDRIQTADNGHVHVRFVDNGVVSVRPQSQLEVQVYRYDADNSLSNEVRLKLDQGVTRSISGAATAVDKSRFRLNTPIAAIGVRGTDFIVQVNQSGMRASVADGAIVVSPLTATGCHVAAVGPCGEEAARVLSAGMGRMVAEVGPGDGRARLVPITDTVVASGAGKVDDAGRSRPQGEALTFGANDRAAADLLTLAKESIPGLNRPGDLSAALVWGRWGLEPVVGDKISVPASVASLGRNYTGIGDADMGLYRAFQTEPGPLLSDSLNAAVDFRLSRASATFVVGGRSESASIDGGTLNIDFARRSFATGLLLSAASGATAELRAGGEVRNNGIFAVRDADQLIAGAVSSDGKEAGYLFERSVGGGLFKGHTLWGAK